ncbi:MAG: FAD-dependent oxidoreductase, partial [Gammaproteobacteria bacterium]|nr:FAD-dependent oxidoreductase [Gammaproteobacteria bacterium]
MTDNRTISQHIDFSAIQDVERLRELDNAFLEKLNQYDANSYDQLVAYRAGEYRPQPVELSEFILKLAPHVEDYLAELFEIKDELNAVREHTLLERHVAEFRQEFVMRRAKRYRGNNTDSFEVLDSWLNDELAKSKYVDLDRELATACYAIDLLGEEESNADNIDRLTAWCHMGREVARARTVVKSWNSFKIPQSVDPAHLVSLEQLVNDKSGRQQSNPGNFRQRDGFALTDNRMSLRETLSEVEYCVYCHDHDGDFCSKGFPENKKKPELGLKVNPLGVTLTGCPLEEKISEMHLLKREGHTIAALAVAMIDNPMIPATGHRICNDCMKGCIYQKKDPVNIPQVETRVLTDVLDLPWGVEVYDLLTRWNPLRPKQYLMQPYNGRNVLISGMGPAGFTMAHHLTMEGCAVVGIDGLKIEPLAQELLTHPVRDFSTLQHDLGERILAGFGGVAEYGITVRWDKNFLTLIYMTLARRQTFQVYGGARLGGTVTLEDAWELGFDHVCIANGAGLPRVISIGNSLARGMRQANDFLMALQLTGAAKSDSLANLQVRMPAAVVGGGLTAIDTATEVQSYYITQVEKVLYRYEELVASKGEENVRKGLNEENRIILDEFLDHGHAVREERQRAKAANQEPDFISLLREWGGVTIVYRRGLNESPAYQRNHEEVIKA